MYALKNKPHFLAAHTHTHVGDGTDDLGYHVDTHAHYSVTHAPYAQFTYAIARADNHVLIDLIVILWRDIHEKKIRK